MKKTSPEERKMRAIETRAVAPRGASAEKRQCGRLNLETTVLSLSETQSSRLPKSEAPTFGIDRGFKIDI
jgi:hypothetical protein